MATSSFFYGGSIAPEQNTVDELIDRLNAAIAAADEDRVDAEQAAQEASDAASNALVFEQNTAGLNQQTQNLYAQTQASAATAASSATASSNSANSAALSASQAAASALASATSAAESGVSATNAAESEAVAEAAANNPYVIAVGSDLAGSGWTYDFGLITDAPDPLGTGTTPGYIETVAENIDDVAAVAANIGTIGSAVTAASDAAASASSATTSATNAASSATAAAGSATTATTQATNAATSATAASGSASTASTAATNAASSASAASTSASSAATSATNAASSATTASGSASAAATSATAAQTAQTAAEAAFDNFDDRYLGPKASAPTLDNDGNALLTGALYFNSTLGGMYVWSGTAWGVIGSNPDSVVGPASSTDNAIARFDGTTGKIVQNSLVTVSDAGDITVDGTGVGYVHTYDSGINYLLFKTTGTSTVALNGSASNGPGLNLGRDLAYSWSSTTSGNLLNSADLSLWRDAANTLAQRNGTNPQTFRLYNTYTDGSNYERGFLRWNTGVLEIGTDKAGTGSARDISFVRDGSVVGSIYNSYGNIFEFYGTLQSSRVVASGPGDFTIIGYQAAAGLNGAFVSSAGLVGWGSTANPNNGVDTALARDSAGVVKVTNGSTGLGVLKASSLDIDTFDLGVLP